MTWDVRRVRTGIDALLICATSRVSRPTPTWLRSVSSGVRKSTRIGVRGSFIAKALTSAAAVSAAVSPRSVQPVGSRQRRRPSEAQSPLPSPGPPFWMDLSDAPRIFRVRIGNFDASKSVDPAAPASRPARTRASSRGKLIAGLSSRVSEAGARRPLLTCHAPPRPRRGDPRARACHAASMKAWSWAVMLVIPRP